MENSNMKIPDKFLSATADKNFTIYEQRTTCSGRTCPALRATKRGFSLIEALIALVLLFLMALFIINVFPTLSKAMQLSESHTYAAYLGSNILDDLRRNGFDAAAGGTGSVTLTGIKSGAAFSKTINYNITVQTIDTDKKSVWVTLSWKEPGGNKQITLETILVKP